MLSEQIGGRRQPPKCSQSKWEVTDQPPPRSQSRLAAVDSPRIALRAVGRLVIDLPNALRAIWRSSTTSAVLSEQIGPHGASFAALSRAIPRRIARSGRRSKTESRSPATLGNLGSREQLVALESRSPRKHGGSTRVLSGASPEVDAGRFLAERGVAAHVGADQFLYFREVTPRSASPLTSMCSRGCRSRGSLRAGSSVRSGSRGRSASRSCRATWSRATKTRLSCSGASARASSSSRSGGTRAARTAARASEGEPASLPPYHRLSPRRSSLRGEWRRASEAGVRVALEARVAELEAAAAGSKARPGRK